MNCGGCGKELTYRQLAAAIAAALAGVGLLAILVYHSNLVRAAATSCVTRKEVEMAVETQKKCLTIYDGKVYDLTVAKKWDLTGHVGKHLCGKEYTKEVVEAGPHKVSVVDKFYWARLCDVGETPVLVDQSENGKVWPKYVWGMSWLKFSSYLALGAFLLNFATCYAMPWAKTPLPWKGSRPGRDEGDALGAFLWTRSHKVWAWLAIFALSFHGILGFSGVLFGKWF